MNWQAIIDKLIGDRQLLWWLLCAITLLGFPGRTDALFPDGRREVTWAFKGGLVGAAWLAAKASWENSQKIGRLESLLADFIKQFQMHCDRVENEIARNGRNGETRAQIDAPLSQRCAPPPPPSVPSIATQ